MLFCELLQFEEVAWAENGATTRVLGLTFDSRTSGYGSLFFCIRGAFCDGHEYASEAYRRGCRHFVVARPLSLPADASVLICPSPRKKMAFLAARYYGNPASDMRIIGITGTKGKTTTALMLRGLLERAGVPTAYIGSSGVIFGDTHIPTENTTPSSLDLQRYLRSISDRGIKTAVMEVSSQALVGDRVLALPFSMGIFTNLSRDHIGVGEHADMAAYQAAKLRLFTDFLPKQVVLNAEDPFSSKIERRWRGDTCLRYGNGSGSFLRYHSILQYREKDHLYTAFRIGGDGEEKEVTLEFAGVHYILDFLAALSAATLISKVPYRDLLPCASQLTVAGRSEVYAAPSGALFVIDYAHNGASLAAALRGLRPYTEGRLICLFGSVGERTKCRRSDMAAAAERHADFSVITADNPGNEDADEIGRQIWSAFRDPRNCIYIREREDAIRYLVCNACRGDVVLLAGKGDETYQLSAEGRVPFQERRIIEDLAVFRKPK